MTGKDSKDVVGQGHEVSDNYREDEVSLIDLWRVIVKRKKVIMASLLSVLVLVGLWITVTKPVYESRTVLALGQVGQVGQVEAPQLLVQRLKEEYRVKDESENEARLPAVKEVKTMEKSLPNGVEITVQAYSAEEARKFLADIVAKVIRQHQVLFTMARDEQQKQLESLQKRRDDIEQILLLVRHRMSATAASDAALAGLLTLEQDRLLDQLPQIEQQQAALRMAMSELQSKPTVPLRQPTLPVKPVKPRSALYLALAAVLGLMLGVFGAFFAEFIGKARQQGNEAIEG